MSLFALLEGAARRYPNRAAIYRGPLKDLSYAQLHARSLALGAALRHRARRADRVAVIAPNCPEYLEILFGIWAAGMTAVPVNAKLHPDEMLDIIADAQTVLILAAAPIVDELADLARFRALGAQLVPIAGPQYQAFLECAPTPVEQADPDSLAWLFYTSGTTGRSKGAMLSHRNLIAMTVAHLADFEDLTPHDNIVHAAPMSHGSGLLALPYVARGCGHVIPESTKFDPAELLELCRRLSGCGVFLAPTMVQRVRIESQRTDCPPAGLRSVIYGGGPMYLQEIRRSLEWFGPVFRQLYGQGEAPMTITGLRQSDFTDRGDELLGSVGWPRAGMEVAIVDEQGHAMPMGAAGEIVCRGQVVMQGYWRNEEASKETLRGGWLHTGDIGFMDGAGRVTLRDRSKDLIISGGSNIYPREVEEVLLTHPDIGEACVIGEKDMQWGENVVAFIVVRDRANIEKADLERHCLSRIARFKRPRRYIFVQELPKNNYGKVLKRELASRLESNSPEVGEDL